MPGIIQPQPGNANWRRLHRRPQQRVPGPQYPKFSTLIDDFQRNDIATQFPGTVGTVRWSPGQVSIQLDTSYDSALVTPNNYDLTGSVLALHLSAYVSTSTQTSVQLISSAGYGFFFGFSSSNFNVTSVINNVQTTIFNSGSYNAVTMAWIRVRESAGTVFFDTAPDGLTWTNQFSTADTTFAGSNLAAMSLNFFCGDFGTDATGQTYCYAINCVPGAPLTALQGPARAHIPPQLAHNQRGRVMSNVGPVAAPLVFVPVPTTHHAVGAFLNPAALGYTSTDWTSAANAWTLWTGQSVNCTRHYMGAPGYSISSDMTEMIAGGTRLLISLTPSVTPSFSDYQAIQSFMQALVAAGAVCDVALFSEPFFAGLTSTQYITAVKYYGPAIRQYYPLVFNTANSAVLSNSEATYYPGDAFCDKVGTDFYASGFVVGSTLNTIAAVASGASPPKPFTLWEINGSPASTGQTQLQVDNYFAYVISFMQGQQAAGFPIGDICLFNGAPGESVEGAGTTPNGGFEGGGGNWSSGSGAFGTTSAQSHSGSSAATITSSGVGTINIISCTVANVATEGLAVTAGDAVNAAGWFKAAVTPRNVGVNISYYTSGGVLVSTTTGPTVTSSTTAWTQATLTDTAPATAAFCRLIAAFSTAAASGEVHFFDDPELRDVQGFNPQNVTTIEFGWDYRIALWQSVYNALNFTNNSAPLAEPVKSKALVPFLRGRVVSRRGILTSLSTPAPVYPLRGPIRAKLPSVVPAGDAACVSSPTVNPYGRQFSARGPYDQLGPRTYPLEGPLRGRLPGPTLHGRVILQRGVYDQLGPPVYPILGPISGPQARRGPPPTLKGRTITRVGPYDQLGSPITYVGRQHNHGVLNAPRGRSISRTGTFTAPAAVITVTPLQGPVRSRLPEPVLHGRIITRSGIYDQLGAPTYPLRGPIRTHVPATYSKGRESDLAGAYDQLGPSLTPPKGPVRAAWPVTFSRGRAISRSGVFDQLGPAAKPLQRPVRAPVPSTFSRGRDITRVGPYGNLGAPITPLQQPIGLGRRAPGPVLHGRAMSRVGIWTFIIFQFGPPVYPLQGAHARPQYPVLHGRTTSRTGTFTLVTFGPPITPLRGPVRAPIPATFSRGRAISRVGVFEQAGPPVKPRTGPVRAAWPARTLTGRETDHTGAYGQLGAPITPLRGPVRSRVPQTYSKGREYDQVGLRIGFGPPVKPLDGAKAQPQYPVLHGRAISRRGKFTAFIPAPPAPFQPLMTRGLARRSATRVYWQHNLGLFRVEFPGNVQPAATRQLPRRLATRAYWRATPLAPNVRIGPNGTVQPAATRPVPRRSAARVHWLASPLATTVRVLITASAQPLPLTVHRRTSTRALWKGVVIPAAYVDVVPPPLHGPVRAQPARTVRGRVINRIGLDTTDRSAPAIPLHRPVKAQPKTTLTGREIDRVGTLINPATGTAHGFTPRRTSTRVVWRGTPTIGFSKPLAVFYPRHDPTQAQPQAPVLHGRVIHRAGLRAPLATISHTTRPYRAQLPPQLHRPFVGGRSGKLTLFGTVQPLPTRQQPRRRAGGGVHGGVTNYSGRGPIGVTQPPSSRQLARRTRTRVLWRGSANTQMFELSAFIKIAFNIQQLVSSIPLGIAFNVYQSGPFGETVMGDVPWISPYNSQLAAGEDPWISPADGTIRMSDQPTTWMQGGKR